MIISDKVVTTRKPHTCSACGRRFEKGTRMKTQVNTYEGIQAWRTCPTCTELLGGYSSLFDDGYGIFWQDCVSDALNEGQTPEDLLIELRSKKLYISGISEHNPPQL